MAQLMFRRVLRALRPYLGRPALSEGTTENARVEKAC